MKLKIILLILSCLIFTLALVDGVFYYKTVKNAAIQQNHHLADHSLAKAAKDINSNLLRGRSALSRLAASEPLQKALQSSTSATVHEANEALDSFNNAFQDGIFYLIDGAGNTLASSNRNTSSSFVGNNYGFRPYFKEAIQGRPSLFLGVGVTSKKPGIYLSYPVYDLNTDRVMGVVTGKLPVDNILDEIKQASYQGIVAFTGPYDIVFLSNHEELVGKFLWETSAEGRAKIAATRQFGTGPWPWAGIKKIDINHAVDSAGHEFTVQQHNIKLLPGWHLTFLHEDSLFMADLSATLTRKIGVTVAAALVCISLLVVLLYLMASKEIRRRMLAEDTLIAHQKNLEIIIEERTAELLDANEYLETEIVEHKKATRNLEYSNKSQEILNRLLRLSQQVLPLQEFFNEFLQNVGSCSELGLQPKGVLFLVDRNQPDMLLLKAHHNLDKSLLNICKQVPFGRCLCGRAAATGKLVFVGSIDECHENTCEGILPHGHYCVPIIGKSKKVLGVYSVYTEEHVVYDKRVEKLLVSIASVLASVIEYKRAGHKMRESHEKHQAITNTAHDAIIMVNHLGLISFWNPAAEKIFGFTSGEALGQNMHHFLVVPGETRKKADTSFERFLKTGHGSMVGKTVEMIGQHKKGTEFPLELSLSAVLQNKHWAAIGIVRDITERKNREAEKIKMDQQLRQAQKMEAIGTLAGGIAHDFNNILTSILGYAELIRDDMDPSRTESLDDVAQVIKAGKRAKELVAQIRTFSCQAEDDVYPIQVSMVIKEALKLLRASLPTNIEIKQLISAGSTTILSDPAKIHQLIMNLSTNAYRAMREDGGILEVRLETFDLTDDFKAKHLELQAGHYLRLLVRDSGHGMDPTVLPRIFDPYFSTNKKEDGTGLGLAVVHGIVTGLGGAIEVSSELGVGTTFKIFLPVAEGLVAEKEFPADTVMQRGGESILLVDDELPILLLEERMLAPLGYKITCRTSSVEAMELFRNCPERFDLVITDHSMPNMTGAKLAEGMVEIRPDIPIILCTGYSELNMSQDARDKCIREIIMKPVDQRDLAQAIRQVLDDKRD